MHGGYIERWTNFNFEMVYRAGNFLLNNCFVVVHVVL